MVPSMHEDLFVGYGNNDYLRRWKRTGREYIVGVMLVFWIFTEDMRVGKRTCFLSVSK